MSEEGHERLRLEFRVRRGSKESPERVQRESGKGPERFRTGSKSVRRGSRKSQERVQKESGEVSSKV